MTFKMMTDPGIRAGGVISVASNIAPKGVKEMTGLLLAGKRAEAEERLNALKPLFGIITVKTEEESPYGPVTCRARNPLATKSLMAILGMPVGGCRRPLGKMSRKGIDVVVGAARKVWKDNPEVLQPIADFFAVDIESRLYDESLIAGFVYEGY
jgi:4-hydroxy-tetrahydrodipicolinate synthase